MPSGSLHFIWERLTVITVTELWKVNICYLENKAEKVESGMWEGRRVLKISSQVVRVGQFLAVLSF